MSGLEPPPPYSRDDPHSPPAADGQSSGPLSNSNSANPITPPVLTVSTSTSNPSQILEPPPLKSPSYESAGHDSPSTLQNVILTPPASPRPTEHQHSNTGLDQTSLTASAAYFESRPSIMQAPPEPFVYQLILLPDSGPDDLPYPEPEHMWSSRDVTLQDWQTFKNFIFPYAQMEANVQLVERKLLAELDRREEDLANGDTIESPTDELYPAQLRALPGVSTHCEKRSSNNNTSEPEAERSQRVKSVITEWNEGFFQPRGFVIELSLVAYPEDPLPPARPSATAVNTAPRLDDRDATSTSGAETHQPRLYRNSSDSTTLCTPASTSASIAEDDPLLALRQAFAKFLMSPRDEMGEAFDDLGSELRSQRSANLRVLKQELRTTTKELRSEWKCMVEQHKQSPKSSKGKGKAKVKVDGSSNMCPSSERQMSSSQQKDLDKSERKQRHHVEKAERKQKQHVEKVERKQKQDAEKRELKEAKKLLKEEHKRQVRELYSSKRKSSTCDQTRANTFELEATASDCTQHLQSSQEVGVERVPPLPSDQGVGLERPPDHPAGQETGIERVPVSIQAL